MIIISGQSCHTFFFRGRLHLKINCANNKLTCEGKRRLIKMSRSQLFLIVSCFVPSGQTQSLIPSIPIWSQYSSKPFHYHGGHPHQRSKKGRLFFNKFGYYVIIILPNTVFPSLAIFRTCFFLLLSCQWNPTGSKFWKQAWAGVSLSWGTWLGMVCV